jgi:Flp pilus assembly secretin CpaC
VVFDESKSLTTKHQYRGLFKLFSTFGKTDVLSSPRINVLDGQEAYVLVGVKEPVVSVTVTYPDGTETYAESVDYVETGVKLSVTPQISEDGYIRMKIKPEVSSAEMITTERGSQYPKKTVSESETTVIVRDGQTIVLAGLMKEEKQKTIEKVPGLGDIPLVGKLFSGKYEKTEKTELVILLTPHISGEATPQEIEKYMPKEQKAEIETPAKVEKKLARKEVEKKAEKVMAEEGERKLYSEYYLQVTQRLYDYIQRNYIDLGLKGEVNVVFLVDKNGNLVGEPAVIGDVEPAVRDLAIEVVKKASPYPPFPEGLKKKKEAFNILLSF